MGSEFITYIEFGDQWFQVIVDTGSSDTWLAETGFSCVTDTLAPETESNCDFGPLYTPSSTFSQIAGENFNISYGDGEFLIGIVGTEDVTLANITVKGQEVAIVSEAYWEGDGITSGLTGLAYPALTSAFFGTNPANDNAAVASDIAEYNPIFTTMYKQGLVAPVFTLVLERGTATSTLAIGGLPPGVSSSTDFATASIQIVNLIDDPFASTQYSFYTIYPSGFTFEGAGRASYSTGSWPNPFDSAPASHAPARGGEDTVGSDFPMIVDSGTTLLYLPSGLAAEVIRQYDPPGAFSEYFGADVVYCDATPPAFGVTINGTTFQINATDLILQPALEDNICIAGIQDGGEGPYILGDVFLKNVIAVYDVGASEMKFAAHESY